MNGADFMGRILHVPVTMQPLRHFTRNNGVSNGLDRAPVLKRVARSALDFDVFIEKRAIRTTRHQQSRARSKDAEAARQPRHA